MRILPKSTKWITLCQYNDLNFKKYILQAKKYHCGDIRFRSIKINEISTVFGFKTNLDFTQEFDKLLKIEV